MVRSIVAVAGLALVAASLSGAAAQPVAPISTGLPGPYFGSGEVTLSATVQRARPLDPGAPRWARRLYGRSVRVLLALTDSRSGAQIAGDWDGWDHVWPRDAAAGAIALDAAGLHSEGRRVAGFLVRLDLSKGARFEPDGEPVPGRPEAGDASGWVATAARRIGLAPHERDRGWRDRQDYGENVTGDLLGNAIAAGAPTRQVRETFLGLRGLGREPGGTALDSAAAWAIVPFARPGLREPARRTLLALARNAGPYGIAPTEDWTAGQAWTAPTAWSAWALVRLGELRAADRLLAALHRAETPAGMLPERVSASVGTPLSTTPVAWSHAFAILALRARYG